MIPSKATIMHASIYNRNFLEAAKEYPDNSFDVAICDPPYNLSKGGKWNWDPSAGLPGFGGRWDKVMQDWDDMSLEEYFQFTCCWLLEVKRLVKPEGSLWIHGTYHNAGISNFLLQLLEIEIINEVIWYKRNSFPNLAGRRLTASHESIIWAHTGKNRKYFFDYEFTKNFADSSDQLKMPGKQMRTVWDVPNNKSRDELKYGKHPTQKPVKLIERMLRISCDSTKDIVVLSPFAGSGTDLVAASNLGLKSIGFEIDESYYDLARQRLTPSVLQQDLPLVA